ncbi:MAG: response regulator [Candidatus Bathyarchaeia archaeon]
MNEKGRGPYSALVVDDEAQLRDLIREFLEMEGYEVSTASSPDEALELAKDKRFHIILTDLKMPGIGGIELLRRVRKYNPYIATIVFTGFGTPEAVVQAFRDGRVNDFLAKPFQAPELYRAVSLAIKEQGLKEREDHFYRELERRVKEVTKELEEKNKLLSNFP